MSYKKKGMDKNERNMKGEHMERTGCNITHTKWKHLRNNKKKYLCKNCLILPSRSDRTQYMQIDSFPIVYQMYAVCAQTYPQVPHNDTYHKELHDALNNVQ